MKKFALILFTAVLAFSAECRQISDQISLKFLCTDNKLISLHVNDLQDTYKFLNAVRITEANGNGTYTVTEHLSNFADSKCKSKYLYFLEVYDEFGIRISSAEKCTDSEWYSPTSIWNKLRSQYIFHKMDNPTRSAKVQ